MEQEMHHSRMLGVEKRDPVRLLLSRPAENQANP